MNRPLLPPPAAFAIRQARPQALAATPVIRTPIGMVTLRPLATDAVVQPRAHQAPGFAPPRPLAPPPLVGGPPIEGEARKGKAALPGGPSGQTQSERWEHTANPTPTATEVQREAILALLRAGPRTTFEVRRFASAMQASTRILELRRAGYKILTERVEAADEAGVLHQRVAMYSLVGEPEVRS